MSDTSNDSNGRDKGLQVDKKGCHCIPCRCKRQFYHKETKTVKENNTITTDTLLMKETFSLVVMDVIPVQMTFSKMKITGR